MIRRISLCLLSLAVISCSSGSKEGQDSSSSVDELGKLSINLNVKKKVLSNGMKVLVSENKKLPIFSIYTFYDVGGRYEYKGTTGSTHFLEHMMFKRTKNFEPSYFSRFIERNGGNSNAYTTFDNTVYYENVPSETLDTILALEADRMENLILDEQEFEKERQVVLEERKMRYENRPKGQLYQAMMKTIFKGTPYGGSVIGDVEDVQNLSRDKMMEFYKNFYAPNNAIMVIVGDVDADDVFSTLEKKFGDIKANSELESLKASLDKKERYKSQARLPISKKLHGQSATPLFSLSFPSVGFGHEDGYALDFVSRILGSGSSSYLVDKFVANKRPKLTSVYAANYTLKNDGVFFIQGQLLDKVSLNRFKSSLMRTLKRSCNEAITERNVQKTKNNILIDYYANIQTNSGLASFLGNFEFYYGNFEKYKDELEIYNTMTIEKVKAACHKYLVKNKSAFISVWNKHSKRNK